MFKSYRSTQFLNLELTILLRSILYYIILKLNNWEPVVDHDIDLDSRLQSDKSDDLHLTVCTGYDQNQV